MLSACDMTSIILPSRQPSRLVFYPEPSFPTFVISPSLSLHETNLHQHQQEFIMASQDSTTRRSILALSLIGALGANSMYGLAWRNGYISALLHLRDHGPYNLPGSNIPILTRFTGIEILDKALTLAGVMFANVTDGSAPASSLYGFQFAGQLVPMFTIMLVEAARRGNKGNIMSW